MEITRKVELYNKVTKAWETGYTTSGENAAMGLAGDLNSKYLEKCSFIKSIRRVQRYTHKEIIVTYDNECRAIYTVPAHF